MERCLECNSKLGTYEALQYRQGVVCEICFEKLMEKEVVDWLDNNFTDKSLLSKYNRTFYCVWCDEIFESKEVFETHYHSYYKTGKFRFLQEWGNKIEE